MKISDAIDSIVTWYKKSDPKTGKPLYKTNPVLLSGPIGIGKSTAVQQAAEDLGGLRVIDLRISQLDSVDFRGIPSISGGWTLFCPPKYLPFEGSEWPERGILFLDEITLGDRLVRACCYQLILDRAIGEHRLKDGWMVVAATNRAQDKSDIDELPAALRNRFSQWRLEPTVADFVKFIGDNDDPVVRFLKTNIASLQGDPSHESFATPRTWERVSTLVRTLGTGSKLLKEYVHGLVGDVAGDFIKFLTSGKTYEEKAAEILAGKRLAELKVEDIQPVFNLLFAEIQGDASGATAAKVLRFARSMPPEKVQMVCEMFMKNNPLQGLDKKVGGWVEELTKLQEKIEAYKAEDPSEAKA